MKKKKKKNINQNFGIIIKKKLRYFPLYEHVDSPNGRNCMYIRLQIAEKESRIEHFRLGADRRIYIYRIGDTSSFFRNVWACLWNVYEGMNEEGARKKQGTSDRVREKGEEKKEPLP